MVWRKINKPSTKQRTPVSKQTNLGYYFYIVRSLQNPTSTPPQGKNRRRNREMASSIAIRSRLVPSLLKLRSRNPRRALFSTEASSSNPSSKVSSSQQQSLFSDFPPPNHLPPPEAAAEGAVGKERKGLKYLSNGLIWAFTGATAAIGYTSYGMSLSSSIDFAFNSSFFWIDDCV